jgi:hypothetical protein
VARALWDSVAEIGRWLAPPGAPAGIVVLGAAVLTGLIAAAVAIGRARRAPPARMAPAWPLALLVAGYVASLLVATSAYLDPIGARLLSPVFPIVVVLVLTGLDRLAARREPRAALLAGAVALVAIWLVAEVETTRPAAVALHRHGAQYTAPRWRGSALMRLIREDRIRPTYSNRTDALYFRAGVGASCWPTLGLTICTGTGPDLGRLGARRSGYLAWFAEPGRRGPYVPAAVAARVRLVPVRRVADGALYRVRTVGSASAGTSSSTASAAALAPPAAANARATRSAPARFPIASRTAARNRAGESRLW